MNANTGNPGLIGFGEWPRQAYAPVLTEAASAGKHIFFLNRQWRTARARLAGELAAPRMVSVCL